MVNDCKILLLSFAADANTIFTGPIWRTEGAAARSHEVNFD